jgi:segregation and condensation protein A
VPYEVVTGSFSGPLDVLCVLVESRSIEASTIRVWEVISLYGKYLSETERTTIKELAEFLLLAARLLLGKVHALLPDREMALPEESNEDDAPEGLALSFPRCRPYRKIAELFEERLRARSAFFSRQGSDEEPPIYDLGDLYALSRLWWRLLDRKRSGVEGDEEDDEGFAWEGFPTAVPEEAQVETRMQEIRDLLDERKEVTLEELLAPAPTKSILVLCLLALLELSRLGELRVLQKELFGHVTVVAL